MEDEYKINWYLSCHYRRSVFYYSWAFVPPGIINLSSDYWQSCLVNPVGITVAKAGKQDFHEIAPAGQSLPFLYSNTFTTAFAGQKQVEVTLSQKLSYGLEKLVTVIMEVPPEPSGTHEVIVTMKIDNHKNMRLKATAIKSGQVKEYGPYPVD